MMFTPYGHDLLAAIQQRTGLSRNDILTHLALAHGADLAFEGVCGVVYRGKDAGLVMSIHLTDRAFDLLRAAQARTGKSYSDLGEALIERWGVHAAYPVLPMSKRRARRKGR